MQADVYNNDRNYLILIFGVSFIVFALVLILSQLPQAEIIPPYVKYLPTLNAFINATCSLILISSFIAIKKRKIQIHKSLNISAFILSSIFLMSYVIFHSFGIETKFPVDNPLRPLYLTILISHIILAAGVLPLILIAFYRGLSYQVEKHRRIARWAFPVWLYVTISGVVVYLMISPYYPF
jgi:putative membrane protein